MFTVCQTFMAGVASQAGDADIYQAPDLTFDTQGTTTFHRGTLLFVPQWQCISSLVFYMKDFILLILFLCVFKRMFLSFIFLLSCISTVLCIHRSDGIFISSNTIGQFLLNQSRCQL